MLQLPSRPIHYFRLFVGVGILLLFMVLHMSTFMSKGSIEKTARLQWDIGTFVRMSPRVRDLMTEASDVKQEEFKPDPPKLNWFNTDAPHEAQASLLSNRFDENLVWAMHFFGWHKYTAMQAGIPPTWDAEYGGTYIFGDRESGLDHLTNVCYLLALELIKAQNRDYGDEADADRNFPAMLEQETARMKNVVINLFENPDAVVSNYDGQYVFDIVLNLLKLHDLTDDDDYLNYAVSFYSYYTDRVTPDMPILRQMEEAKYVIPNWVGLASAKMVLGNYREDDAQFDEGYKVLKRILSWGEVPESGGEFNPVKTAFYFKTLRGNRSWLDVEDNAGYNVDPELWSENNMFIAHALLEVSKFTDDEEILNRGRDVLLNAFLGTEAGYYFRLADFDAERHFKGFHTKYDVKREELIGDSKFTMPVLYSMAALNAYTSLYPYGDSSEGFEHSLDLGEMDWGDVVYDFIRRTVYQKKYNCMFMEMDPKWETPIEPPITEAQGRYLVDARSMAYALVTIFTYQDLPGSID